MGNGLKNANFFRKRIDSCNVRLASDLERKSTAKVRDNFKFLKKAFPEESHFFIFKGACS